jgi:hypothetical protein
MSIDSIKQEMRIEISKLNQALRALEGVGSKQTKTGTRKLSAAGRKRIAAAQRARWAKVRAAKKK